jgi:hypothetical protein
MRTWIICPACSAAEPASSEKLFVEITDTLFFDVTCPKGHEIRMTLEATKYSILFDFGVIAIMDGYYREAISSIATSLERLYEFFIRVVCTKHDIPFESVDKNWKHVGGQSERQLGAFCFLYLLETGKPAVLPKDDWVQFRNKGVHKGYLPTKEETLKYAEIIHDHMISIVIVMNNTMQDAVSTNWVEERARRGKGATDLNSTSHGPANFVPRICDHFRCNSTFTEKLERLRGCSRWLVT